MDCDRIPKCPHCGSGLRTTVSYGDGYHFTCGTITDGGMTDSQSPLCYSKATSTRSEVVRLRAYAIMLESLLFSGTAKRDIDDARDISGVDWVAIHTDPDVQPLVNGWDYASNLGQSQQP